MRTLVLNKQWYPIGNTSFVRAIKLLCKGRAEVLEYYEDTILTPSDELFIPAVILLKYYDKIPKARVAYSKRAVLERDNFECQYCRERLTFRTATIDHVVPRAKGGQTNFHNTVTSCNPCNNRKADKLLSQTPLELKRKPYKPQKQVYRPRLGSLREEWLGYIPKGMHNEFSIDS